MKIPNEFDAIRPYEPEELPEVYERLIGDPQFKKVIAIIMPGVPYEAVAAKIRACKTNYDFRWSSAISFWNSCCRRQARAATWTSLPWMPTHVTPS